MSSQQPKLITQKELQLHTSQNDCWILLHNKVYDVSNFLNDHPGGVPIILKFAGKNATGAFDNVDHSEYAQSMLKDLYKGDYDVSSSLQQEQTYEFEDKLKFKDFIIILCGIIVSVLIFQYNN